jgi:hypothetical protein
LANIFSHFFNFNLTVNIEQASLQNHEQCQNGLENKLNRRDLVFGMAAGAALLSIKAQTQAAENSSNKNSIVGDTRALEKAISEIDDVNGYITIPPGTYRLKKPISIKGKTRLSIFAYGVDIQIEGSSETDGLIIENCHRVLVAGMTIASTQSKSRHAIRIVSSTYTRLRDIDVWDVGGHCVMATDSWWFSTQECVFLKPGKNHYCVHQEGNMNNVVHIHTRFSGYGNDAVYHNRGAGLSFTSCDFSGSRVGCTLGSCVTTAFSECYFEDNQISIRCGTDKSETKNLRIVNNYFQQQHKINAIAIQIDRASNMEISGNYYQGDLIKPSYLFNISNPTKSRNIKISRTEESINIASKFFPENKMKETDIIWSE